MCRIGQGPGNFPAANPGDHSSLHRAQLARSRATPARLPAGLEGVLLGWRSTRRMFRKLDEWLRHRLRAMQLKHWRRGTTMYREMKAMGARSEDDARSGGRKQHGDGGATAASELNRIMPIAFFDRLGVPRLS